MQSQELLFVPTAAFTAAELQQLAFTEEQLESLGVINRFRKTLHHVSAAAGHIGKAIHAAKHGQQEMIMMI